MAEKASLISEMHGRQALRELDDEVSAQTAGERIVNSREAAGYEVAVVLRNVPQERKLFLRVYFDTENTMPVPPIELRPSSDEVPNRVKDALEHPFAYMAAAGIATEVLFDRKDIAA